MDEYISIATVFDEIQFQREYAVSMNDSSVVDTCDAILHNLRKIEIAAVQPVKQDTELSTILQDYGIKDADTLRYIIDQYQKVLVEITGGMLSKLVYPAKTVMEYADDRYRKYHEESIEHGRWENEYLDDDVWWADCTNCINETHSRFGRVSSYAFCPNCGARMGEEDQ